MASPSASVPGSFPIVSFVLTGAIITFAGWLDDQLGIGGVEVADLWTGILVAMGLTAGHTLLAALFAIDDEQAYDRFVTAPLRRLYRDVPPSSQPGFMFLEIDGLAEPVLRDAIARGYMPTLQRWLSSGSHKLVRWDPDLSAQTSASQAGILLGSNEGIPAFRWWDKPRQELLVSSKMGTAHTLEEALSTGNGLLARGGAGRWNAFSGDAAENIGVYSVFGDAAKGSRNTLLGYLLTPYMLSRILTLYLVEVVREWWQAWQQRRKNVLPRVHRGLKYSFIRAGTTTAMQEASRHILTADLLRGVPAVYNTFFGYDEVAHHSGIDREDSLKVLATLDKIFAHLERVAREAPRPYHLFVLSDHGQSQGATFLQKYGLSLADLTHQLVATDGARNVNMTALLQTDEAIGHVNLALSEATRGETRTASVLRRILKPRMADGEVDLGQSEPDHTHERRSRCHRRGRPGVGQPGHHLLPAMEGADDPRAARRSVSAPDPGARRPPWHQPRAGPLRGAGTAGDRQGRGALPARRERRRRGPAGVIRPARGEAPPARGGVPQRAGHPGHQQPSIRSPARCPRSKSWSATTAGSAARSESHSSSTRPSSTPATRRSSAPATCTTS